MATQVKKNKAAHTVEEIRAAEQRHNARRMQRMKIRAAMRTHNKLRLKRLKSAAASTCARPEEVMRRR